MNAAFSPCCLHWLAVILLLPGFCAESSTAIQAVPTQNSKIVPLFEVFELTLRHEHQYANPFFDADLQVTFTAPSKKQVNIGGFFYGAPAKPTPRTASNAAGQRDRQPPVYHAEEPFDWKARFVPGELGRWTYSYVFTNLAGGRAVGQGSFECVKGRVERPGFLRINPANPHRWIFDNGAAYWPIGLQECVGDNGGNGSVLAAQAMEGPFRLDRKNRPDPPPGARYKPGPSMNPVNGDVYFRNYARAGFNLFRFSQKNCSLVLYQNLDQYLAQESIMVDELLLCARKYGMRIMYGLFGYQPVYNDHPENAEAMAKVKRFVKYSVDRWGAYVDIWEFLNEQKADARWYEIMTFCLRALDPYQHPITTSWERPELTGIEINAPHWYAGVGNEFNPDLDTATRARKWKEFQKPVIVGEQGNTVPREQLQKRPELGGVWDAQSALRMRLRNWSAMCNEIAFVFWNTSYAKDGHFMNIWLGPVERQYVQAMQDFANRLDKNVRMAPLTVSEPGRVRGWALASSKTAGVYLHHYENHTGSVSGVTITLDVPQSAHAFWYAPENAAILKRVEVAGGRRTLEAPPFTVDIALLITPDGPPDIDHDGIANDEDRDDDNDGVPDVADAFPLDPEEWADKDGDMIGDNLDADIDADGVGDDKNRNGIPDHEEMDYDGDGVTKANAVPWDAFPLDPKEWRDTDGDGIGDNADPDDDGDGWSDAEEIKTGTNPIDPLSFPREAARPSK